MNVVNLVDWLLTEFLPALFIHMDSWQLGLGSVLAFSVCVSIITYVVGAVIARR